MVVKSVASLVWAVLLAASLGAQAQEGSLRAFVSNTDVIQDKPFWLTVELSGISIETPTVTQGEGLVINTNSPQQTRSIQLAGGRQWQTVKLSYWTMAVRPGRVTVPRIEAKIDGQTLKTDPIVLNVSAPPAGTPPAPKAARVSVADTTVTLGQPFWIEIEATGAEIELPETIEVEGLTIDTRNFRRSSSFSFGRQGLGTTEKRGFYSVALSEGTVTIPAILVRVNGRVVNTDPVQLKVEAARVASSSPRALDGDPPSELTQDDLVFIDMTADKHTVYQGEPILLTMQLWRIKYRRINSGPYRGGLIVNPTTVGFYAHDLEVDSFEGQRGPWVYDVHETRKFLYPTRAGNLQIGRWHWEGIALVNRQSIIAKNKLYYKLDAGPIDIDVKALPPSPEGFSGGVGTFDVTAEMGRDSVLQGVPFKLTITVRGQGNPDAIGAPDIPEIGWAYVSEPERDYQYFTPPNERLPHMAKHFSYAITPLEPGERTVPKFDFVYFDPKLGKYANESIGPYTIDVRASNEAPQRLVVPDSVDLEERLVDILGEDIRPAASRTDALQVERDSKAAVAVVGFAPVLGYLGLVVIMMRRRRLANDKGLARAQRARAHGAKRLRGVAEAENPPEALYRAMAEFIADKYNLESSGLTSADVRQAMQQRSVPSGLLDNTVKILKACERAQYASQRLGNNEIAALLSGAEECIAQLNAIRGKGRPR